MAKKKKDELVVRITGPECWAGDRLWKPGETATVPRQLAEEWILTERALKVEAEVEKWQQDEQ
jgi:hypothetical protein